MKCGAKTRSGASCQNNAMSNGRCRLHGGLSTGAPKGNKNNLKHGIYSKYFTEQENQLAEQLDLSQIDEELKLCKIRLMRALKLEAEQGKGEDALELTTKITKPPVIGGVPVIDADIGDIIERTFSKKDYSPIVDRLIARIQSLTTTRYQLMTQAIDAEMKQIELDKIKSANDGQVAQPVQIVVNVQDARKYAESEHTTS